MATSQSVQLEWSECGPRPSDRERRVQNKSPLCERLAAAMAGVAHESVRLVREAISEWQRRMRLITGPFSVLDGDIERWQLTTEEQHWLDGKYCVCLYLIESRPARASLLHGRLSWEQHPSQRFRVKSLIVAFASVAGNPSKSFLFLNERGRGLIRPDEMEELFIYHEDGWAAGFINSLF